MRADTERDRAAYWFARDWISSAVHELPSGVLDGSTGASAEACAEMLTGLDEFCALCMRLGINDHANFIDACRWHFEHYPRYIGGQRQVGSYEEYTASQGGPLRVANPPAPPSWLRRP